MRAASEIVRDYCGWHIAPEVTDDYDKLTIGSGGIIMLPSLYVTDVDTVTVTGGSGEDQILNPMTDYDWFRNGTVEAKSPLWRYGYASYYGPYRTGLAKVRMTHGYDSCPLAIKSVVFELMSTASETVTANIQSIQSPGYRIQWGEISGEALNIDQKARLDRYRIGWFK